MIDKNIEVEIGGKTYTLERTLDALMKINKRHGSLVECLQRIRLVDVEAVLGVIVAGADLSESQAKKMSEAAVVHGLTKAATAAADYVALLMDPEEEGDGSGEA